ncbi:MAG TPA: glycosyltransferase family 2 protein [Humidesulfovibrio sp.]|uniref:glycosyltransferase family 2 protein n=1 Tax=Humidesulfovibrio sp. TaxID=2910988 RepID=UPI002C0B20C7|nr:glycosyltransferase family 2 protein [Humidesulfovibrio sp.]HWR02659.1 glycosyltransferase family 2 protein [Humidesulfovibrio sp.]
MTTDLQNAKRQGSPTGPNLSIVIPVYGSREILPRLHQRIVSAVEPLDSDFELVLVDDDSKDGSWGTIQALTQVDPRVRGIHLAKNYGQHCAVLCGLRAARGKVIITLDDDLQNPPEEIPKLLQQLDEGYDVVYGAPAKQQHGLLRDAASFATKYALQAVMGAETARKVSPFRAMRAEVRAAFADYHCPSVNIDVLLTWGTSLFSSVTVRHEPRTVGHSNYTLRKLCAHALDMLTGFTTMPLRVASFLGMLFSTFGLVVLCYTLVRYFISGSTVPGFPFLASIIALFSGTQLFALGVIGEYLARMHFRTMNRPPYAIRETTKDS